MFIFSSCFTMIIALVFFKFSFTSFFIQSLLSYLNLYFYFFLTVDDKINVIREGPCLILLDSNLYQMLFLGLSQSVNLVFYFLNGKYVVLGTVAFFKSTLELIQCRFDRRNLASNICSYIFNAELSNVIPLY